MLAFFEGSSIISFRILSILLLFTLTTCQSNNQNFPTSVANQVDSRLDEVEPLSIPQRSSQDDFEGSGVNPDDEDGDVDEGSGDGIEGSGSPPIDDNAQIDTQTNINNIEEIRKGNIELTGVPVFTKTNGTSTESDSSSRTFKPATKTEQPLFSDTRVNITKESTPTSTTIVKTKEIKTSTTIKEKSEKELIVGGAVVFVLLIILVITYIFYRIRKKDEGSYICEDHVQTHRFSNYYQKASTKEFYA
uniref:Syndecan n=1 Tax=Meloidogyne javanica TaxID=6303 RepID=A0A915N5T4_MELJA